ncbi:fluoride efflux transporter CrcB [Oceanobacillus sp. FSL H7-0719]|uniref:fluoride efflux transporter CrcB n=1 Tax=Oceanobacillus sp. FSL H7-0719 TaxID=2954507 RepID=UPI0032507480
MVYFLIGVAGALGAMLRYIIGIIVFSDSAFPYATLCINLIGSFMLARLTYGVFKRSSIAPEVKTAISTGFVGSFTTFSAVSVETVSLFQSGSVLLGALYIILSIFGGLLMSQWGFRQNREVLNR